MSLGNQPDAGLYSALAGSTALTDLLADGSASIFAELAPENADEPLVLFQKQADTPDWKMTGISFENILYSVRAITTGESIALAGSIDSEIRNVLDDGDYSVGGHTLVYSRRESGLSYTETVEGRRYNHRGAFYRIWLSPA